VEGNEAAASSHRTLLYDSKAAIVLAVKELMAHDTIKVNLSQTSWYDTKFESNDRHAQAFLWLVLDHEPGGPLWTEATAEQPPKKKAK
jgi:hypothetical protein